MTTQTKCTGHKTRVVGRSRGRWREKCKNLGDDVNCQKLIRLDILGAGIPDQTVKEMRTGYPAPSPQQQ